MGFPGSVPTVWKATGSCKGLGFNSSLCCRPLNIHGLDPHLPPSRSTPFHSLPAFPCPAGLTSVRRCWSAGWLYCTCWDTAPSGATLAQVVVMLQILWMCFTACLWHLEPAVQGDRVLRSGLWIKLKHNSSSLDPTKISVRLMYCWLNFVSEASTLEK